MYRTCNFAISDYSSYQIGVAYLHRIGCSIGNSFHANSFFPPECPFFMASYFCFMNVVSFHLSEDVNTFLKFSLFSLASLHDRSFSHCLLVFYHVQEWETKNWPGSSECACRKEKLVNREWGSMKLGNFIKRLILSTAWLIKSWLPPSGKGRWEFCRSVWICSFLLFLILLGILLLCLASPIPEMLYFTLSRGKKPELSGVK